jgi:hypothetical protein
MQAITLIRPPKPPSIRRSEFEVQRSTFDVRLNSILIILIAALFAHPAKACLNDTAVERGEQEFKSQYDQPPTPEPAQAGMNPWAMVCLAVGGGLAVGSLVVAVGRREKSKSETGRVAPDASPGRHGPAL